MMLLRKDSEFFNPYFVGEFQLKNIVFYDKGGEVLSTNRGWFDFNENNRDRQQQNYHVEGDIIRKRKIDYSLGKPFLLMVKREYYERDGKFAHLYLPYNKGEWTVQKYVQKGVLNDSVYDRHIHRTGIVIDAFKNNIENIRRTELYEKLKELCKAMGVNEINSYCLPEKSDEIIQKCREVVTLIDG